MASFMYNTAKAGVMDGSILLLTNTIKVMLVTSVYVANPDHLFVSEGGASDPDDAELTGTGYVAGFAGSGRITLASKTVAVDQVNDRAEFDAADLSWAGINAGTAAAYIVYQHITSDALSRLIAYVDTGGFPQATNGGALNITFNAEGVIQFT